MRSPAKPFASQGGPVVLAHRGFSGRYPENTMLAFEKAAELPIDGLEMDIWSTRDGVLVISHDDAVARMTGGEGCIPDYTLAELQELDAGYEFTPDGGETYPFRGQGLTIPTMESVLRRFKDLWINVDIKHHEPEVVDRFCALIREYDAAEQLCVGSFSGDAVERFRKQCPEVVSLASESEIGRLLVLSKLRLDRFFNVGGHAMQIPPQEERFGITIDVVTPHFVERAHRHGTAIHMWTLNDEAEMRHYLNMGIDGIISDFPDRALKVVGRLPEAAA